MYSQCTVTESDSDSDLTQFPDDCKQTGCHCVYNQNSTTEHQSLASASAERVYMLI